MKDERSVTSGIRTRMRSTRRRSESPRLGDEVADRPALMTATDLRDDAERTAMIAALGDLQVSRKSLLGENAGHPRVGKHVLGAHVGERTRGRWLAEIAQDLGQAQ